MAPPCSPETMSLLPENSLRLPILDIHQPLLPSRLSSLAEACKEWGFFHIANHGLSEEFRHRLRSLSHQVFSLPTDSKLRAGPLSPAGTYTPHFIASPFFESLRVSGPDYYASAKSSAGVLFDQQDANTTEFCNMFHEYGTCMMELSRRIVRVLLRCLGEDCERKYYEPEFGSCRGYLRVNSYSPPGDVQREDGGVEGLGMHTDMSCITILYQDDVGGLQVRSKEGDWVDIRPCEGTLVVNIGDLLQAWSNGRLRSSQHRVVLRRPLSRFSLAFFWCFEDDRVVEAPEEVVGEGNRRLYRPFVCLDYVRFRETVEKGRFEKVGYTVDDFAAAAEASEVKNPNFANKEAGMTRS